MIQFRYCDTRRISWTYSAYPSRLFTDTQTSHTIYLQYIYCICVLKNISLCMPLDANKSQFIKSLPIKYSHRALTNTHFLSICLGEVTKLCTILELCLLSKRRLSMTRTFLALAEREKPGRLYIYGFSSFLRFSRFKIDKKLSKDITSASTVLTIRQNYGIYYPISKGTNLKCT